MPKAEIIMKGEPPFNGHILVRKGGNLFIYGECEYVFEAHTHKMIDNPMNQAILSLVVNRLNNNSHPTQVIYLHLKKIKSSDDSVFNHSIFDKLKGKRL